MIADVSADGHRHPEPSWLVVQRWADRCTCYTSDDECIVHGAAKAPDCSNWCGPAIVRQQAREGVDVGVLPCPPPVLAMWTETRVCPHGRRYWIQPTADQLRTWRRNEGGY